MAASSFKSSAEYQRERRELNRRRGVRRLDIELEPKLFSRLLLEIRPYGGDTHPGAALVDWLDDVLEDFRNK